VVDTGEDGGVEEGDTEAGGSQRSLVFHIVLQGNDNELASSNQRKCAPCWLRLEFGVMVGEWILKNHRHERD